MYCNQWCHSTRHHHLCHICPLPSPHINTSTTINLYCFQHCDMTKCQQLTISMKHLKQSKRWRNYGTDLASKTRHIRIECCLAASLSILKPYLQNAEVLDSCYMCSWLREPAADAWNVVIVAPYNLDTVTCPHCLFVHRYNSTQKLGRYQHLRVLRHLRQFLHSLECIYIRNLEPVQQRTLT